MIRRYAKAYIIGSAFGAVTATVAVASTLGPLAFVAALAGFGTMMVPLAVAHLAGVFDEKKDEPVAPDDGLRSLSGDFVLAQQSDCRRCFEEAGGRVNVRMFLCPACGNKRCPKATDHRLDCTGSNEPGQPGSAY